MKEPVLLTPGPLTTSTETKLAMVRDWGSRDTGFIALNRRVRQMLLDVVGVKETHVCVPLQGSGTEIEDRAPCLLQPLAGEVERGRHTPPDALRIRLLRQERLGGFELESNCGEILRTRVVDLAGETVALLGLGRLQPARVQPRPLDSHAKQVADRVEEVQLVLFQLAPLGTRYVEHPEPLELVAR